MIRAIIIDDGSGSRETLSQLLQQFSEKMEIVLFNPKSFYQEMPISNPSGKLALPTSDGYTYLRMSDIVRCEADSNYTRFHTKSGKKILVPKTLKEYEAVLTGQQFIRVHRSHLINLDYVARYTKSRLPSVVMEDGAVIAVSLRRREELLMRLSR